MARPAEATRINLVGTSALVCDENVVEQDLLAAMLGGFGVSRVFRCDDPELLALETRQRFDVIFVGISARDPAAMQGISRMRMTVDHPSRTSPIVVVSSYTPKPMVQEAQSAGASFVIAKPLTPKIVFDRIIWLASNTRDFVETEGFYGPDRRVRNFGPPLAGRGRRSTDLSPHVGDATQPNMTQEEIDQLMMLAKPRL